MNIKVRALLVDVIAGGILWPQYLPCSEAFTLSPWSTWKKSMLSIIISLLSQQFQRVYSLLKNYLATCRRWYYKYVFIPRAEWISCANHVISYLIGIRVKIELAVVGTNCTLFTSYLLLSIGITQTALPPTHWLEKQHCKLIAAVPWHIIVD